MFMVVLPLLQFAWWDSETRGNWLWGYTMLAFMSDNSEHKCRAISMADDLVATADDDGYIGVYDRKWRYAESSHEDTSLLECNLKRCEYDLEQSWLSKI
jgi:hypothetical protein